MKNIILSGLLLLVISCNNRPQTETGIVIPLAPEQYRKPAGYDPAQYRYKYSLAELRERFSEQMMQQAAVQYQKVAEVNEKGRWKATKESIDRHYAPEWFADCKFGMWIDWGLWSVAGWATPREEGAVYPDWYEFWFDADTVYPKEYQNVVKYHAKNWGKDFERDDFIPFFTAKNYQPEKLIDIAEIAGMKYVVPFCKHHSGFCLWPSSYTQRNAWDMTGKDLITPLVERCKEKGLKFGFYFSLEEWEYPIIDDDGELIYRKWAGYRIPYFEKLEKKASGKIAVRDYLKDYLIPQATEFIDRYDPDLLWYDGDWDTPADDLASYDIAAYYYNQAEGRKEVAVNDRYGTEDGKWLRSRRGDYYTDEYGDMKKEAIQTIHPWEEGRGISQSYGFNWEDTKDNIITSKDFIQLFVDVVANGGNLLLLVNLDSQGALPDIQEARLREIGQWLKINGEGIYATRAYATISEDQVYYTRSKDEKTVYAISVEWPGTQLKIKSVQPKAGSSIYMLGYDQPLAWNYDNGITTVAIPSNLQNESNRPCKDAYTFKIQKD